MLCRRCGMDSKTTDVCEWCKRPMLPPDAKVTSNPQAMEGAPSPPEEETPESKMAAAEPPTASAPPLLAGPEKPEKEESPQGEPPPPAPASAPPEIDDTLRPLGAQLQGASGKDGDPTALSVDISQYMGDDQSIFRPVEKPTAKVGSIGQVEGFAARKQAAIEREQGKEVPEKVRLFRAAVAGGTVAIVVTMIRFAVTKEVPPHLLFLNLSLTCTRFSGALMYAAVLALLLGFMLGALMAKFKLGPFAGVMIGLVLGFGAIGDKPWGLIAGVLAGILSGIFATKGVRRVINV